MSKNTRLDRRHDVNAGEMLPQRLTRVEDMEQYWDGLEKAKMLENDPDYQAHLERKREEEKKALEEKKASIGAGDQIILLYNGVLLTRTSAVTDTAVKVGPHWYGWEFVKKPSRTFLEAVEAELPGEVK